MLSNPRQQPQDALEGLRLSSLQLCWYLDSQGDLDQAERGAVLEAIGEIGYIADGLSLALGVQGDFDEPDFSGLLHQADRLTAMVASLVSH